MNGEQRKNEAHARLQAARGELILRGRRVLLEVLLERGVGTIDNVRARVPLPGGISPRAFGAVPGELVRAGIIAADGFVKSSRPESHARPVQVWRLVDWAAARRWLAENPEPVQTPATPAGVQEDETPPGILPGLKPASRGRW